MLIFRWFRCLQWLTLGSSKYQSWYKGKPTLLPWEGEGLNWISKLIWFIPSHTGTCVLVQWRERAGLRFGDEQSVFISSPALNLLEPNWNHTLRPCTSWATLAAPVVCKTLILETVFFQVMMCSVCALVYFSETRSCTEALSCRQDWSSVVDLLTLKPPRGRVVWAGVGVL